MLKDSDNKFVLFILSILGEMVGEGSDNGLVLYIRQYLGKLRRGIVRVGWLL